MNTSLKYTLKVWLTSVFISPVVIALYEYVNHNYEGLDECSIILFLMLFGGIFSIPSAGLMLLATNLVLGTNLNNPAQKIILTISGVLFTEFPFFLMTGSISLNNDIGYMIIIYAATIIAGIWIYRLQPLMDEDLPESNVEFTEIEQEPEA